MKILYVEDNLLNQHVVLASLKKQNYTIIIANDGIEAIEKFKENNFDFILMDLMMPNMDGYEATIKIREIERANNLGRCPIIALTANFINDEQIKCFSVGMDGFLAKPFKTDELESILKELNLR